MNQRTLRLLRRVANDKSVRLPGGPTLTFRQLCAVWNKTSKRNRAKFRRRLNRAPSPRFMLRWLRTLNASVGHWPV